MNNPSVLLLCVLCALCVLCGGNGFTTEVTEDTEVRGVVKLANGRPAASVLVAAVPHHGGWWSVADVVRTGSDGSFRITGLAPGNYGLTATSVRDTAGFVEKVTVPAPAPVEIRMTRGGRKLTGLARHVNGDPLRGRVIAARLSSFRGDLFVMETDEEGRFAATLPPARYRIYSEGGDGKVERTVDLQTGDADLSVQIERVFHVTPPSVIDWIKRRAVRLRTPEAGNGFEDMQPLRSIIGDARIVALGEATHGTREFFQLKHRMLEFLVSEMGFTVFAIEASAPDTKAVNDYVLHGIGEPEAAVRGMLLWIWSTEEVLDMVRWMRAWNENPAHTRKLKFHGIDMQNPDASVRILREYLKRVDPQYTMTGEIDAVEHHVTTHRDRYVGASSVEEWEWARRQIDLIRQGEELTSVTARASDVRDRWMAANVKWILEHEPPGTKVVLWAHNGHVSAEPLGLFDQKTMGMYLRETYGDAMRIFGFAFDRGSFQAMTTGGGGLDIHEAQPAKPGSFDGALAAPGYPLFALDLRTASGVARRWAESPLDHRMIGVAYSAASAGNFWGTIHPSKAYDAVFFVANTTAARALQPRPSDVPMEVVRP